MSRRRIHWSIRVAAAFIVTSVVGWVLASESPLTIAMERWRYQLALKIPRKLEIVDPLVGGMAYVGGGCLVGIAVFTLLGLSGRRRESDRECRCRACNHILRGLSAPRCPECGEPI